MLRPLLLAAALAACQGRLSEPPEVRSEADEGSTELVFLLDDQRFDARGQSFTARGVAAGEPVAFEVRLEPWTENPPGYVNMSTWECKAQLLSRGAESDAFVRFLDRHYATSLAPRGMAPRVECKAFSPWEDPGELRGEPVKVVLLFSGGFDETRDAEAWLEVRPRESRVILREKEPRFRRALVQALAQAED